MKDYIVYFVLLSNLIFGGFCTEYLFETIGVLINHPIDMPFIGAFIIGIFFGEITIPAAILLWIFMLFI